MVFNVEGIQSNGCKYLLVPTLAQDPLCLTCAEQVLGENYTCQEFCGSGQKNDDNVCLPCINASCEEVKQPKLEITKEGDLTYLIALKKGSLHNHSLNDFKDLFKVKIDDL